MVRRHAAFFCVLAALTAGSLQAQASAVRGFAPVSVSAANYRSTPKAALIKALSAKAAINPSTTGTATTAAKQVYVFVPGEYGEVDLAWTEACRVLEPALAARGFVNAAAPDGTWVHSPQSIELLLRVSYGTTLWRAPAVRSDHLTWGDGLMPQPRGRSVTSSGGGVVFDRFAGGNDDFAAEMAINEIAREGIPSSKVNDLAASQNLRTQLVDVAGSGNPIGTYESTREFHLLVVDAFDHAEVRAVGKRAKRIWSTFIAAPRERRSKFADLMPVLAKAGSNYFGTTTTGLQVFDDHRAEVQIGETTVAEEDAR